MNYQLNQDNNLKERVSLNSVWRRFRPFLKGENKSLVIAFVAILINSGATLLAPAVIGHTVDTYIKIGDYHGILINCLWLGFIFIAGFGANYLQIISMGGVGRRTLFVLRNVIFKKLQELPVSFFNQNKSGDLISRINNDTDKLNQFFSQALMQFIGSAFLVTGAGFLLIFFNNRLGLAALIPALMVLIVTRLLSPWIKRANTKSLRSLGNLSAEVQESLSNFKVIVAFNRLDYFRKKFKEVNDKNFSASVSAGIANSTLIPIYGFAYALAQLIVLVYGIYLIGLGQLTVGLLISFLLYVNSFYNPLRQLASIWSSFQLALASFDRVSEVLSLESNLNVIEKDAKVASTAVLEFKEVSFHYEGGREVLNNINFSLQAGKTYALVGPTGGGKTTTASLMARLYDPSSGLIMLDGSDIRSYQASERGQKIGFILQEPFLFTGTVRDNILYGNECYLKHSNKELADELTKANLDDLLARFDKGLDTPVASHGETISLGQKQLIAFMRAILRKPDILILDEATANIDTVTEQLLEAMLKKLPLKTTKVIIAHRLNTIENADEIFFINAGQITPAGSMQHAVDMLLQGQRSS